jgi:hypothetical protein
LKNSLPNRFAAFLPVVIFISFYKTSQTFGDNDQKEIGDKAIGGKETEFAFPGEIRVFMDKKLCCQKQHQKDVKGHEQPLDIAGIVKCRKFFFHLKITSILVSI